MGLVGKRGGPKLLSRMGDKGDWKEIETVEFFIKNVRSTILTRFLNLKMKNFVTMEQNWLSSLWQHYEV